MADEALKEVLCIPGKRRNYAVEFPYVELGNSARM